MKIKFITLLFSALFIFNSTFSQEQKTELLTASPTAEELGKFGNAEVGLFTGTAQVDIKLFDISTKNLNLPLSLSYNTNGLLVDKISSWIGFDWNLNAGGVITRIVKGRPDDISTRRVFPYDLSQNLINASSQQLQNIATYLNPFNNNHDYEPDIYSFNFLDYSGTFYIDNSGQIILTKHQNLKINYTPSITSPRFSIVNKEGIEFKFVSSEMSKNSISGPFQYSSMAFYLEKIIHPEGDEIDFYYSPTSYVYGAGVEYTKIKQYNYNDGMSCPYVAPTMNPIQYSHSVFSAHLDSIVAKNSNIVHFNKTFGRLDIGDPALSEIEILNHERKILKTIKLSQKNVYSDLQLVDSQLQANYGSEVFNEINNRMF